MNLRDYERNSIVQFVGQAALDGYFKGRVLDYGCGKQPYREIVEAAGGEYHGFDRDYFPANVSGEDVVPQVDDATRFNAILCTQVIQYVPDPGDFLSNLSMLQATTPFIERGGHLVMTYPTNWPEVEPEDLHRFTKAGMERLLTGAGFTVILHERRGTLSDARFPSGREKRITALGDEFAIGYGVIARA